MGHGSLGMVHSLNTLTKQHNVIKLKHAHAKYIHLVCGVVLQQN